MTVGAQDAVAGVGRDVEARQRGLADDGRVGAGVDDDLDRHPARQHGRDLARERGTRVGRGPRIGRRRGEDGDREPGRQPQREHQRQHAERRRRSSAAARGVGAHRGTGTAASAARIASAVP